MTIRKPGFKKGMLTLLFRAPRRGNAPVGRWLCLCDCGRYVETLTGNSVEHCGCLPGQRGPNRAAKATQYRIYQKNPEGYTIAPGARHDLPPDAPPEQVAYFATAPEVLPYDCIVQGPTTLPPATSTQPTT